MNLTQVLILEISPRCNLAHEHPECPTSSAERWAGLDVSNCLDEITIYCIVRRAYEDLGFRGLVGFHYYNEPLLSRDILFPLMRRIRQRLPQARFMLWTNGTQLDKCSDEELALFEQAYVSNYHRLNLARIERLIPNTQVLDGSLDDRLTCDWDQYTTGPCYRPFLEWIVDYHGNCHLCCYDWRGRACVGNVFNNDLAVLVQRRQSIRDAMIGEMGDDTPRTCLGCSHRFGVMNAIDPSIAQEAAAYHQTQLNLRRHFQDASTSV